MLTMIVSPSCLVTSKCWILLLDLLLLGYSTLTVLLCWSTLSETKKHNQASIAPNMEQILRMDQKLNYTGFLHHTTSIATAHHQKNDTSVGTLLLQTAAVSIIRISSVKVDNVEWLTNGEHHPYSKKEET